MKSILISALAVASTVSAHSWLECTNHDDSQIRGWMQGNSTRSPPVIVDPAMPWFSYLCKGWPRHKENPGNWIDESTNYIWNLAAKKFEGDTNACHPNQRSPNQAANAPIATAAPGGTINLRYGGNGHARGAPQNDIGTVQVYWKGKPEMEFKDQSEFTQENQLASAGFADDSFAYPANPAIKSPLQGLVDKGNWMKVKLPNDIAPGRHAMVWTWKYAGQQQWSTCFDVQVSGSATGYTPAPAVAAPVAAAPAVPAPVAAAVAPVVKTPEKAPAAAAAPAPAPAPVNFAEVPASPPPAPVAAAPVAAAPAPAPAAPAPAPAAPAAAAPVAAAPVIAAAPASNAVPDAPAPKKGKACKAKKETYGQFRKRHARHFHH